MARSHARLLAAIWSDPDWLALSSNAQRLYVLVLSQPKLSLVGAIDYLPNRWAQYATDTTIDDIETAVDELADARFVLVDRNTCELAIRSFARHDLPSNPNVNVIKGVWSAWSAVSSPRLRAEIARCLPQHLFDQKRVPPPPDITESQQVTPVETDRSDEPSQRPDPTIPLPSTVLRPPPAAAVEPSERVIVDAIELLTARHMAAASNVRNKNRYREATRRGKLADHGVNAQALLDDDPRLTAQQLANLLEPPSRPRVPDWVPVDVPDATEAPDAIELIRAERQRLVSVGREAN